MENWAFTADAVLPEFEASFTALDRYARHSPSSLRFSSCPFSIVDLAKRQEALSFPGLAYADASLELPYEDDSPACRYFSCEEGASPIGGGFPRKSFLQLELLYDPGRRSFLDPRGAYGALRGASLVPGADDAGTALFDLAILLSRYEWSPPPGLLPPLPKELPLRAQRDLLMLVLTGAHPERAFELLWRAGYLSRYLPEIAALRDVAHAKDYHPEGDAWRHTMETFTYRKLPDLRLSIALLLHDVGKPESLSNEGRRFDGHADIGGGVAARLLSRLGFPAAFVSDIAFLVRTHMMPAALPRLPLVRSREAMEHPLFPMLLELYRCDEMSSFRGPDGYYEACRTYRAFIKNAKNPWRSDDGRRMARRFLG